MQKQMQEQPIQEAQEGEEERTGKLVVITSIYRKAGQRKTDRFVKKFYGQTTTSHGGKYQYRRKGLLDKIPNIKLGRGVIIVRHQDLPQITNFLDQWQAEYATRTIILKPKDQQTLTQQPTK